MLLPEKFLDWAYFDRVRSIKKLIEAKQVGGPPELGLIFRHTPVFCTASNDDETGHLTVNGKVVGAGFVLKKAFLEEAVEKFKNHVNSQATMSGGEYVRKGVNLLLELLYTENREKAQRKVDFSKISTLELAEGKPSVAEHTWTNLQRYTEEACIVYYMPPTLSFEIRGNVEIHTKGLYHEFVNLVHDCITRNLTDRTNKPCIILNVKEVYDNSATPKGFGTSMIRK